MYNLLWSILNFPVIPSMWFLCCFITTNLETACDTYFCHHIKSILLWTSIKEPWLGSVPSHFMMTSSNGNIFRVTGHLCGEFTGQWRWALMFSLICAWICGSANNREAGDLDAIAPIMTSLIFSNCVYSQALALNWILKFYDFIFSPDIPLAGIQDSF